MNKGLGDPTPIPNFIAGGRRGEQTQHVKQAGNEEKERKKLLCEA